MKTERFELALSKEDKALIEKAAAKRAVSVATIVRKGAVAEAKAVLAREVKGA